MYPTSLLAIALGIFKATNALPQNWSVCPTCSDPVGCYSGGLKWSDLHGSLGGDFPGEVLGDVLNTCSLAAGFPLPTETMDQAWQHCSTWAAEDGKVNHINWAIANSGLGAEDRVVNYDECVAAFTTEINGCEHGSIQGHGGYKYWIDPNEGPCA
ncbi:hypothetical protein HJFPF1_10343 [Paramyrothecium foliicola]|nr:hypothetical protein HJFPF1_10343 [Paramyrothecium foliicola]